MAERIASGEIHVEVDDRAAIAALHNVDEEFSRTMRKIDREKAVANIGAEMSELDDKVEQAKRKLRKLKGEKAAVRIDGNTEALDRKILLAERSLKRIDGQRATAEIKLKGAEKALAAEKALIAVDDRRAKAFEKNQRDRDRIIQRSLSDQAAAERANWNEVQKRSRQSLAMERQRAREMSQAEREAFRMEAERARQHRTATVGIAQQTSKIIEQQRAYAKLTDQLERLNKKRPIGREQRAKVNLDAAGVVAKMEAIKAELNFLGSHPPVDIKADIKRKGVLNKFKGLVADMASMVGNKAAGLQDLTLRLGPFTSSLRGLGTALAFLGPTITDLVGAAGALVGVLGAGIAGAATVGAGALTGFISAGLGFKFATRNTAQELTAARTAINAYQTAWLKNGKNSDKAKTKLKEMNNVLRQISPLARETALGVEDFYKKWDNSTKTTQKNLGVFARVGFQALSAIRPVMAHQTNELSGMLAKAMGGVRDFFKGEGKGLLSDITKNFDASIPRLLHGLGSIGHAFLNLGREGSKYLSPLTAGFDRLGGRLLAFTKRDDFGATVKRWVGDAGDLLRFFGALTRVVVHFFGAGSVAGDGFIKTMTNALNRWDKFIQSDAGHNRIADFFKNSVKGSETLYTALKPLVELFALWAIGLEPAVRIITQIFSWVTRATSAVGKLVGLQNPLATFGATLGAMWAVAKIGSFVSFLARAVTLMRELGAMGTITSMLGLGKGGGFLSQLKGQAGSIAAGGEAAAAEIRAAMLTGGAGAAAEIRAAMMSGGAAAGAENAAGRLLGPNGAPIRTAERTAVNAGETAAGGAAASKAAGAFSKLRGVVTGVGAAFGAESVAAGALATGGLAIVAGAAVYGAYKLLTMKSASEKLHDALKVTDNATSNYGRTTRGLLATQNAAGAVMHDYNQSVKTVAGLKQHLNNLEKSGKKGTQEYTQTLDSLNQALNDRADNYRNSRKLMVQASKLEQDQTTASNRMAKAQDQVGEASKRLGEKRQNLYDQGLRGAQIDNYTKKEQQDLADAQATLTRATNAHAAAERAALVGQLNYKRGLAGLIPLAGRAATAMAKLAKRAPNMSQTISLKYADPRDAGAVATRANAALKAGVKSSIVTKIIADSSSADEAIRRINRVEMRQKIVNIVHKGGQNAIAMLEKIAGRKLTRKELAIAERGGAGALSMLRRIIGTKVGNKTFQALLRDLASGKIQSVQALLNSLRDKTVTLTTNKVINTFIKKQSGGGNIKVRAAGRRPGGAETALVGEGKAHEYVADAVKGTISKVTKPTFMNLRPSQAVIPTEPAHKAKGRDIFAEMAKDLGIPGFLKGKHAKKKKHKDPALSSKGRQNARGDARAFIKKRTKPNKYSTDNLVELDDVERAKRLEDNFRDQVQRDSGLLDAQEPDTFIKKVGTDPQTGDDIFDVDQGAIDLWAYKLGQMAKQFDILVIKIKATATAVQKAMTRIGDPYGKDENTKSVMGLARHNIHILNNRIAHEERIKKGKGVSKKERQAADTRIGVYRGAINDEQTVESAAKSDWKMLDGEMNDIGDRTRGRLSEAYDAGDKYRSDASAVAAKADTEKNQANPKPDTGSGSGASAAEGLTYAGQSAALGSEKASVYNQFAGNTFSSLPSVASAIGQGIVQGMTSNPSSLASVGSAIMAGGGGLDDRGGRVSGGGSGGGGGFAASAISSGGAAAAAMSPSAAGGVSAPAVAGGGITKTINQTNNFAAPPPDQHTFAQGVAFELGAAL